MKGCKGGPLLSQRVCMVRETYSAFNFSLLFFFWYTVHKRALYFELFFFFCFKGEYIGGLRESHSSYEFSFILRFF